MTILDGIGSTEMLHIFISNTPDDKARGPAANPCPATRPESSTTKATPWRARRGRISLGQGRLGRGLLLAQPREDQRDHAGRVAVRR